MEGRNQSLPLSSQLMSSASPMRPSYRVQSIKKSYPLPILTLLPKNEPSRKANPTQNQAFNPRVSKFNLRKALEEYSSEMKKKQASQKQFNTRILIKQRNSTKKKKRTTSEPANPLVQNLPRKTDLLNGFHLLQTFQSFVPHQQRSQLKVPKIYRTVRFIKKPKIAIIHQFQTSRYLRWDSFCTSIACNKRIISKSQRRIQERTPSINSLSLRVEKRKVAVEPGSELRGWEQQPRRYLTACNSGIESDYDQF